MNAMQTTTYNTRLVARVTIEATTPLAIGSGKKSILTDATINRDANDLPFIPGTTLAGLIRHAIDEELADRLMGFIKKKNDKKDEYEVEGSRLIVTEAKLLNRKGKAIDGLLNLETACDDEDKAFLKDFKHAPIRQHAKINHRGVTEDKGKFDEGVVPKGARFCFEMELMANPKSEEELAEYKQDFKDLLRKLRADGFRVGGKSRNGFGKIEVVGEACLYRELDLSLPADLDLYLKKSASLADEWDGFEPLKLEKPQESRYTRYKLEITPKDFLFFGSGFGNEDVDHSYIKERFVEWNEEGNIGRWHSHDHSLVVPASSVKGALAHRTAYYYNKECGIFAENLSPEDFNKHVGKRNKAVFALFGCEGNEDKTQPTEAPTGERTDGKRRGHVLFADIIRNKEEKTDKKIHNHVKIDRFTGGAIDGALFDEEALIVHPDEPEKLELELLVDVDELINKDQRIIPAFEEALKDVCKGMLPLGGNVNKGYGQFEGKLLKDGNCIYE
jgi:CRISPR-associated RAMP protein